MGYLSNADLLLLDEYQKTGRPVREAVEQIVAEHRERARTEVLREVDVWLEPVLNEAAKALESA